MIEGSLKVGDIVLIVEFETADTAEFTRLIPFSSSISKVIEIHHYDGSGEAEEFPLVLQLQDGFEDEYQFRYSEVVKIVTKETDPEYWL